MSAYQRVAASLTCILLSISLVAPARAHTLSTSRAASPIYIGQILPLTGANASALAPGPYEQAGSKLALRQINAQGGIHGRPLELILADDHSTTSGAIAAITWLTHVRHVTAIIGPNFSGETQPLTPYIKQAGIPVIIGATAPILTHEGDPWVFRTRPNDAVTARVLATFAVTTLHLSSIALIHGADVSGVQLAAAVRADLEALGVTPVTDQSFTTHTPDFTAQVLAIKKSSATALISHASNGDDYARLAQQMHQVGLHLTWLGNPILASVPTIRRGGALLYGTYAAADYAAGQSPEAAAFDRLSETASHLPGGLANGYVYDGLNILALVMRKVGTAPQAIRAGILSIRGYHGVMGTYNFDRNGDGLHQNTIVQNVDGRLHVVKILVFPG